MKDRGGMLKYATAESKKAFLLIGADSTLVELARNEYYQKLG